MGVGLALFMLCSLSRGSPPHQEPEHRGQAFSVCPDREGHPRKVLDSQLETCGSLVGPPESPCEQETPPASWKWEGCSESIHRPPTPRPGS